MNFDLYSSPSGFLGALGSASLPAYAPYLPASIYPDLHQLKSLDGGDQMGSFSHQVMEKAKASSGGQRSEAEAELELLGLPKQMLDVDLGAGRPAVKKDSPLPPPAPNAPFTAQLLRKMKMKGGYFT
jgi:hypothetical protein